MRTDVDPKEAIATIVVNAMHLRGFDLVLLVSPDTTRLPETLNLTEFAFWLRDAMTALDAAIGVTT